ncbi:uncharacterized protein N7511_006754 [Penicillium nucicola]|uniref:uncharacterized protein n=1 Tax=Penicillium nucicola TaxID=1850975 RepID=UPI00254594F9|nr:uncharacterized protein N7511_006754 [Penicillium nucicola]KAJ5758060.1 hypothetical protein N7511_006754 [Penicillium nucicola]
MSVKTRACLISDTHTLAPNPSQSINNAYRHPLPSANILIHAGDLTKVGYRQENEIMLEMLKEANAELKLVIAGNHDITLDEEYFTEYGYKRHKRPEKLGNDETFLTDDEAIQTPLRTSSDPPYKTKLAAYARSIKDLWTGDAARSAGIIYLEEGMHSFTLSTGAKFTVYASPYQPEFYNWAFAYPLTEDRFNLPSSASSSPPPKNPIPDFPAVDILLTHGPPKGVLDAVPPDLNVGCPHLMKAAWRARPRLHVFGHIHEGWGAQRGVWSEDGGETGGVNLEHVPTDPEDMLEFRGAFCDVSDGAKRPLRVGEETLFVNASVVTVNYEPQNAPWVVDLELPLGEGRT